MNRRNLMAFLGFAPLGTTIMSTEDVAETFQVGAANHIAVATRSNETQLKIAAALDNLAAAIRRNECDVREFETNSKFMPEDYLQHELTLRFELTV
jgi:hypothetical protein